MKKKWTERFFGKQIELQERLFYVLTFLSMGMSFLCLVKSFFTTLSYRHIILLSAVILIQGLSLFVAVHFHRLEISKVVSGMTLSLLAFPVSYFTGGGSVGGALIWFVMGYIYVFLLFSGWKLVVLTVLSVLADGFTFVVGYIHPEYIQEITPKAAVFDAVFGVVCVGIVAGALMRYTIKLLYMEREAARQQKEELERVSDSKNTFFASVSHEIRTPINSVIGLTEMIMRVTRDPEILKYVKQIKSSGKMLLNLVNDILDLSQMELKKMQILPLDYEPRRMFKELRDMVRVRAQEKNLELILDIDSELPGMLRGDEKRIKQVALNILTNAVKYTHKGSVTLSVRCEKVEDELGILIMTVRDTGIGIRKEDLENLFQHFSRVDVKRNDKIQGSGLGLSIVKQLLELMDGTITVDSIYTKGSVFTVRIPQEIVDEDPLGYSEISAWEQEEAEENYERSFEAPEARVLIVDDNEMNRTVTYYLLQETKVQLDMATSGDECLQMAKEKYYHVILMDYRMPGMSGAETLKALRRQENGLCRESAVIMLTANSQTEARELYETHGFDGFLVKPIKPARMEELVLRFLPDDIVEYRRQINREEIVGGTGTAVMHKKRRIYITADGVCDLPEEFLEKYDVKLVYQYVCTERGRFADTMEIDAGNLDEYMNPEGTLAHVESVSVEEYETFFAETLYDADNVIHVSMASCLGSSYENAKTAAQGYDHVYVIDTGNVSCGMGLLVLVAARMAINGSGVEAVLEEVEKMKEKTFSKTFMPHPYLLYENDIGRKVGAKLFGKIHMVPVMTVLGNNVVYGASFGGYRENIWKSFIHKSLRHKRKINTEIVFITYVSCNAAQQQWIRDEVMRLVPFKRVVMQKASFTNAINVGAYALGIGYFENEE